MAVTHPDVALPVDAPSGRRVRRVLLGVGALGLLALLATAAAVASWTGYEAVFAGRVVPGVAVAELDLSGLPEADARAALASALAARFDGQVTLAMDGTLRTATYAELGRSGDVDATLAAVMAVGRTGEPLEQLRERFAVLGGGVSVGPVMRFDTGAVAAWLREVAAGVDRPAVRATVEVVAGRPVVREDVPGVRLDQASLLARVSAALADPAHDPSLRVEGSLWRVEADRTDIEAAMTVKSVHRMLAPVTLKAGVRTWTVETEALAGAIRLRETRGLQVPVLDRAAVAAVIPADVATRVRRDPVETSILVTRDGRDVGFVAGKPGRHLDRATTAARIADLLRARAIGSPAGDAGLVRVAASPVPLEATDEEVAGALPELVAVGTWTTSYQVSERNGFGANITIPARLIDGTYIAPGDAFDFWEAIGPVTYGRGFRDGAIIIGGRSQPTGAIAGGICSASTTLFNAAARAGLEILERDNHYYYIDRYPLGLDATVSKKGGRIVQNMRFRNDTSHGIYIRGSAGPGWVRFTLYSRPNGREVAFSRPQVWDVVPARDTTVVTSALPAGQTKRVEYPVNGMRVSVTRTVRENGRVLHRDEFFTRYGKVDGILEVGTG